MSWAAPRTWTTAELVTAPIMNSAVRDNLLETAVAKVTTQGDLVYATGANALARLAKGTARQVLAMNSGATAPEWVAAPASLLTATGDLLYASGANTPARLPIGSAKDILVVVAGIPAWVTPIGSNTTWTDPVAALTLDQILSDLRHLGGTDGNTHSGNWVPEADGARDLGSSIALRWRDAWLSRLLRVGTPTNAPGTNLSGLLAQLTSAAGFAYLALGNGDSANTHRYLGAASAIMTYGKVTDAGVATEQGRVYSSGGWYHGDTPADPGANNLQVQGHLYKPNATFIYFRNAANSAWRTALQRWSDNVVYLDGNEVAIRTNDEASGTEYLRVKSTGEINAPNSAKISGGFAPRAWIPAAAFTPTTGQAATYVTATYGSWTGTVLQFADAVTQSGDFNLQVPVNYAGGNVTFRVVYGASVTSGNWVVDIHTSSAAINGAYTAIASRASAASAVPGTVGRHRYDILTWSSSLPAAQDNLTIRINRIGANGSDTAAGTIDLLGVMVEFGS